MSFRCSNCSKDNVECVCSDGPVHLCVNCGLAPSFKGFDDCLQCSAAFFLTDPAQLALIRKLHAGTPWLATLNAEISRQLGTPIACGRNVA